MGEDLDQSKYLHSNWFWLLFIAIVCGLLMLAFPLFGTPVGYDLTQHFRFAAEYHDALMNGSLIPLWADVENHGFGSVGVRFYPPLADLVLAVTQLFTNDWFQTTWLNSFFWMFPGVFGVYFWVKELRPPAYAAFAAILYAAMPYHLLQIYQLQLYSEFVAASILPFCFLFSTRLVKHGKLSNILGLAISCSLLLHTHLPSSMIGLAGLAVYTAIIFNWKEPFTALGRFALAGALAIASAAYYLVRLVTEMDWVKHSSTEFSSGFFDHRNHFLPLINKFDDRYWSMNLWQIDLSAVFAGLILLPLIVVCALVRKSPTIDMLERKILVAVSVTGMFSVFMLSGLSGFVWNTVTVFQKIQFPWRFLSLASLIAAVSLSLALQPLMDRYKAFVRVFIYTAAAVILCVTLFHITQIFGMAGLVAHDKYYESVVSKRAEESCKCWWPTWAESGAFENAERVSIANRKVNVTTWDKTSRTFDIESGTPGDARIATFYYPHWKATINGSPVEVSKDLNGTILIPLSENHSAVRLYFEEPRSYFVAFYLSIATIAALAIALLISLFANIGGHRKLQTFDA